MRFLGIWIYTAVLGALFLSTASAPSFSKGRIHRRAFNHHRLALSRERVHGRWCLQPGASSHPFRLRGGYDNLENDESFGGDSGYHDQGEMLDVSGEEIKEVNEQVEMDDQVLEDDKDKREGDTYGEEDDGMSENISSKKGAQTANLGGIDDMSAWEETTTESDVKKGIVRPFPHGFKGHFTCEGNVLDEALLRYDGWDIPKAMPDKHNDPNAGDIGIIWTQYNPKKPMPNTTEGKVADHPADPLGLTGPELDDANLYDEHGMNPIDKWLGRPGHIWVQSITRGSPAAECGLIEEGDLLVGVRVKGSEELDMASWSLRNALELIVGEPGEPVQLMLQRPWTNASVARLKARRKRWKDDLNDDPDVRRGLQIAAGESVKDVFDMLDGGEFGLEGDESGLRKEIVNVTLLRRSRAIFEAFYNGSVEASRAKSERIGPRLMAAAMKSMHDESALVWKGEDFEKCVVQDGGQGFKHALDQGGMCGKGVIVGAGRYDFGAEPVRVMDGRMGGVNVHVFVKGSGDLATRAKSQRAEGFQSHASWLNGSCVFGTPLYWTERHLTWNNDWEVIDEEHQLSPSHPWIRTPLLCNAGGSFQNIAFTSELAGMGAINVFNGMWLLQDCLVESWDSNARAIFLTDAATVSLKRCKIGGGCDTGIWACRRAALSLDSVSVAGFSTGIAVLDDASASILESTIRLCEQAIFTGNCAQVRMHGCRLDANDFGILVRASSCSSGEDGTVNEYAELDMVGCKIFGRLWFSDGGISWKLRNFLDVGNEYFPASEVDRNKWNPNVWSEENAKA